MREAASRLAHLMKFWLVDIWGSEWDWERRKLLVTHYWSYLRMPPIPAEYLPDAPSPEADGEQVAFSDRFRARIEWVQSAAASRRGVFLTYRPLGKNLRLLGTAIRGNVDRNRAVYIEANGPLTERRALALRGHQWSPWVWIRTGPQSGEPSDAAEAWNELFRNPPHGRVESLAPADDPSDGPRLTAGAGPFGRDHLETVLKLAAATRYAFSPAESIMDRIRALKEAVAWPPPSRPVLGIHVRRGDAASAESETGDQEPQKATRKSFGLGAYLDAADEICGRYGIEDVFLATESADEIARAREMRPQYRFLWMDYDRSIFPDIRTSSLFIEDLALEHPERARCLAVTGILDLYFFCECHAFIGAFNSEFSVLGWLLAIGSRGRLVPYVSLSRAASGRSLNPFRALLNVHNNCPLELYHW